MQIILFKYVDDTTFIKSYDNCCFQFVLYPPPKRPLLKARHKSRNIHYCEKIWSVPVPTGTYSVIGSAFVLCGIGSGVFLFADIDPERDQSFTKLFFFFKQISFNKN